MASSCANDERASGLRRGRTGARSDGGPWPRARHRDDALRSRFADAGGAFSAAARDRYRVGATAYAGRSLQGRDRSLPRCEPTRTSSAALSFDVARSYDKLGDASGALEWYRDYLRQDEKTEADADAGGAMRSNRSKKSSRNGACNR